MAAAGHRHYHTDEDESAAPVEDGLPGEAGQPNPKAQDQLQQDFFVREVVKDVRLVQAKKAAGSHHLAVGECPMVLYRCF